MAMLYRRVTRERWERVHDGWPEAANTVAPLLVPARQPENCGRQTSAACTVQMTVGRVGAALPAMRARRSTCAASRYCGDPRAFSAGYANGQLTAGIDCNMGLSQSVSDDGVNAA